MADAVALSPDAPPLAKRAELSMRGCGAHVTLSRGEQSCSSSSVQAHRTRQMGPNSGRQRQHRNDGDGTARRWQHSMTMAAQQEVMAMQETELQGVMPAKIADAVLVIIS